MNSDDIFHALNESYEESLPSFDDTDSDPNFSLDEISDSDIGPGRNSEV